MVTKCPLSFCFFHQGTLRLSLYRDRDYLSEEGAKAVNHLHTLLGRDPITEITKNNNADYPAQQAPRTSQEKPPRKPHSRAPTAWAGRAQS